MSLKGHVHDYFYLFLARIIAHGPFDIQEFGLEVELHASFLENASVERRPISHVIESVYDELAFLPHDLKVGP